MTSALEMTKMSEIIIPCLRCSANAKLRRCGDGYRVVCPECGLKGARKCETAHVGRGKAKQLAIQKWNQMQCNIVDAAIEARCWGILQPPYGENLCVFIYRGLTSTIRYDVDDNLYIGEIVGIKDAVGFHGRTLNECLHSSEKAVDKYLKMILEER